MATLIWKCWQDRAPYSDAVYEAALKRRGSPLFARLESIQLAKSLAQDSGNKA